jgi:hypothetical protein
MSATLVVAQDYGTSYSGYSLEISKNIFYLVSVDDGSVSKSSYPIRIPESGVAYSFEQYLRVRIDVAPAVQCSNFLVWYDSGSIPAGQTLTVNSDEVASYTAPTDTQSTKGTRVDFTTKDSEVASIALSGTLTDIGDYTSYLVFQLEVLSTATAGSSSIDFIIQYDEV